MIQLLICAVLLVTLVTKMAPENTPIDRKDIVGVTLAALVLQFLLGLVTPHPLWQVAVPVMPALLIWGLLAFWWDVPQRSALKIASLFAIANLGVTIGFAILFEALRKASA